MNINDRDDTGVVFRKALGHYTVQTNGRELDCVVSSLIHKQLIYPTADPTSLRRRVQAVRDLDHVDPVAIGDHVRFVEAGKDSGMIIEILPRRNQLSRPSGLREVEQIIASNVDLALPVFSAASPAPKWGLLDRYLVTAEAAGLPALILITKLDLAEKDPDLEANLEIYRRIGYPIHRVSSHTGEGIEELNEILHGKLSVLIGKSGVGKTSLLNALQPGLGLRVKEVSQGELGKGRHTTTHHEMFKLDFGGRIVDTPGMREFGLWNIDANELVYLFPEMAEHVGQCKFGLSCQHDREPGCAIRAAVMTGKISPQRYKSYMNLRGEL